MLYVFVLLYGICQYLSVSPIYLKFVFFWNFVSTHTRWAILLFCDCHCVCVFVFLANDFSRGTRAKLQKKITLQELFLTQCDQLKSFAFLVDDFNKEPNVHSIFKAKKKQKLSHCIFSKYSYMRINGLKVLEGRICRLASRLPSLLPILHKLCHHTYGYYTKAICYCKYSYVNI